MASACLRLYAPLASTKSSASGPIASRAIRTRREVVRRTAADLHLDSRDARRGPAAELVAELLGRIRGEPAAAVHRRRSRTAPSSVTRATSSSRALRSHSAASTAEIAIEAIPGRPRLRIAATIAAWAPGTAIASRPFTTPASRSRTSRAVAVSAYE